jgi:hypothetical protein
MSPPLYGAGSWASSVLTWSGVGCTAAAGAAVSLDCEEFCPQPASTKVAAAKAKTEIRIAKVLPNPPIPAARS